jgi:hypothetical protein
VTGIAGQKRMRLVRIRASGPDGQPGPEGQSFRIRLVATLKYTSFMRFTPSGVSL